LFRFSFHIVYCLPQTHVIAPVIGVLSKTATTQGHRLPV